MEARWFPTSKEVQDAEIIKQGVGICLLGQDGILLVDFLENCATITVKYYVALLEKLKLQLIFKLRGTLSKGILFLQGMIFLARRSLRTRDWEIFILNF
jgi:hypothetical protein